MIDKLQASNQSNSAKKRLIVLISGGGSNLQAFIDLCASGDLNATVVAVISNKPDAGGLDRAAAKNIPNLIIDHRNFENREAFDQALSEMIDSFAPDLIILAGFMRILTSEFVNHFDGKLINIHPSLYPPIPDFIPIDAPLRLAIKKLELPFTLLHQNSMEGLQLFKLGSLSIKVIMSRHSLQKYCNLNIRYFQKLCAGSVRTDCVCKRILPY